jgi:hypothetical protein
MYLTLRPPWGGDGAAVQRDAGVGPVPDAGVGSAKPRGKRRSPGRAGTVAAPPGADTDETEPPPPPLTAADRQLEWRGDEVKLPPAKIDMSAGGEARRLDDAEINAVISSQSAGVRDCAVQGAAGTDLNVTIRAEMIVDGTGRVTRSRLQAPRYLFEHGLLACAQRALGRMRFPATGAPTRVTLE